MHTLVDIDYHTLLDEPAGTMASILIDELQAQKMQPGTCGSWWYLQIS